MDKVLQYFYFRVDKDKGYIDLSKRRVSKEDIERCTEKYSKVIEKKIDYFFKVWIFYWPFFNFMRVKSSWNRSSRPYVAWCGSVSGTSCSREKNQKNKENLQINHSYTTRFFVVVYCWNASVESVMQIEFNKRYGILFLQWRVVSIVIRRERIIHVGEGRN